MKKKWISILAAALFFSTAGAFYYEGRPDPAAANEEQVKSVMEQESEGSEADIVQESESSVNETTTDQLSGKEENTEDQKATAPPAQVEKPEEQKANTASKPETIKDDDGYIYHLIEDKKKYSNIVHLIDAAASIDASLYGIKNSDVFSLIKNGKSIGGFSTGSLSIESEYKSFALQMHSFYKDKGIEENIDLAIRTGATISVDFEDYTGYHIQYKDGNLIINH